MNKQKEKFKAKHPTEWGYYWIIKSSEDKPKLYQLVPSKQYKNDSRSVEIWECPGIGRTYLNLDKFPRWRWFKVDIPLDFL